MKLEFSVCIFNWLEEDNSEIEELLNEFITHKREASILSVIFLPSSIPEVMLPFPTTLGQGQGIW